jgi:hypothetical protein
MVMETAIEMQISADASFSGPVAVLPGKLES